MFDAARDCQLCPLANDRLGREQPVGPDGNGANGILALAQGPGQDEVAQGRVMVGLTGEMMRTWLRKAGLNDRECWLWNTTMCLPRTPKLNRPPTVKEVRTCFNTYVLPWLLDRKDGIRLIVTFGGPSTYMLTGLKVSAARGKLHKCIVPGLEDLMVFPTWHASYVHRDYDKHLGQWVADRKAFIHLLKGVDNVPLELSRVSTYDEWAAMDDALVGRDTIAVDTETTGLREDQVDLLGVAISGASGRGFYVDNPALFARVLADNVSLSPNLRLLHNAPYDLAVLAAQGYPPELFEPFEDTMLAAHVLGWPQKGLKQLALGELGLEMEDIHDVTGGKPGRLNEADPERAARYAATDAVATYRLWTEAFAPILARSPRVRAVYELDRDLIVPLLNAQRRGLMVDRTAVADGIALMQAWEDRIQRDYPWLPLGSNEKVGTALVAMGAPLYEKTETDQVKVDKEVLFGLAPWLLVDMDTPMPDHVNDVARLADCLLRFRRARKAKGYLRKWLVESEGDGAIRTHLKIIGPKTGRLASGQPLNLQNVAEQLRVCFVPRPGHVFLVADYSQLEYRVLAMVSKSPRLRKLYEDPTFDIHGWTMARVQRDRLTAKRINFLLLFGGDAFKMQEITGLPYDACEAILGELRRQLPEVMDYRMRVARSVTNVGYYETLMGRKRYFPGIRAWDFKEREAAVRESLSQGIQGSASEILKLALTALNTSRWSKSWLLTVHDDVLLEVQEADVLDCARDVKQLMEAVVVGDFPVRLRAELKWGRSWGDLHKLEV